MKNVNAGLHKAVPTPLDFINQTSLFYSWFCSFIHCSFSFELELLGQAMQWMWTRSVPWILHQGIT